MLCSPASLTFKNKVYMEGFLKSLRLKVLEKAHKFPEYKVDKNKLFKAKVFRDFDELYTAPVFGYLSPEDYWNKASSKPYLSKIEKATLLINSDDDPFLPNKCYPIKEAKVSKKLYLEITKYGGHVGYHLNDSIYYSEKRTLEFLNDSFI